MWQAFADMLPYSMGLIISPFPVIVVIALLISADGWHKTVVFEIAWLVITFGVLFGAGLFTGTSAGNNGQPPVWASVIALVLGVVMAAIAALTIRQQAHRDHDLPPKPPGWLRAIDGVPTTKVAGIAVLLIVANPVNLISVLGAAIALGAHRLPIGEAALAAFLFTLLGSLTVLAPFVLRLAAGAKAESRLTRIRTWLAVNNDAFTICLTLVFAALFVGKGLRGLLG